MPNNLDEEHEHFGKDRVTTEFLIRARSMFIMEIHPDNYSRFAPHPFPQNGKRLRLASRRIFIPHHADMPMRQLKSSKVPHLRINESLLRIHLNTLRFIKVYLGV